MDMIRKAVFMILLLLACKAFISIFKPLRIIIKKIRKHDRRRLKKEWIKRKTIETLSNVIVITAFGFLCFRFYGNADGSEMASTEPAVMQTTAYAAEYKSALDSIPFTSETLIENQTIWEELVNEVLGFSDFDEWKLVSKDNSILMNFYMNTICSSDVPITATVEELNYYVSYFYDTSLLPLTNKSFAEINAEIPQTAEEREKVDSSVYREEFTVRALNVNTYSNFDNLFQAGRAASDTLKRLIDTHQATFKDMVFFGAMASGYYKLALAYYEENDVVTYYELEYKIAEVYIWLARAFDFEEDNRDYRQHFLLLARAHLLNAQKNFPLKDKPGEIHNENNYQDVYMAEVLYELISVHGYDDENIREECIDCAERYLSSPNIREKSRTSCKNIIAWLK